LGDDWLEGYGAAGAVSLKPALDEPEHDLDRGVGYGRGYRN
jgi:hypothetical protein